MLRTTRDEQILETLALRVRVLSLSQVAAAWWAASGQPLPRARARMTVLTNAGLVQRLLLLARPLLSLRAAVLLWQPGDEQPNYGAIADRLKRRWTEPPRPTTVFVATNLAARQFAGVAGRLRAEQATHDIHVAALYLLTRATAPTTAARWWVEDLRGKAGYHIKDPDVLIEDDSGHVVEAIEFGGEYDAKRVEEFHRHCAERELPYQLW